MGSTSFNLTCGYLTHIDNKKLLAVQCRVVNSRPLPYGNISWAELS